MKYSVLICQIALLILLTGCGQVKEEKPKQVPLAGVEASYSLVGALMAPSGSSEAMLNQSVKNSMIKVKDELGIRVKWLEHGELLNSFDAAAFLGENRAKLVLLLDKEAIPHLPILRQRFPNTIFQTVSVESSGSAQLKSAYYLAGSLSRLLSPIGNIYILEEPGSAVNQSLLTAFEQGAKDVRAVTPQRTTLGGIKSTLLKTDDIIIPVGGLSESQLKDVVQVQGLKIMVGIDKSERISGVWYVDGISLGDGGAYDLIYEIIQGTKRVRGPNVESWSVYQIGPNGEKIYLTAEMQKRLQDIIDRIRRGEVII